MARIRVYVAERHGLSRYGIVRALRDSPSVDVVGVSDDGRAAAQDLVRLTPDVAIVAERLPSLSGLDVLRLVKGACPTRVVVLASGFDTQRVYAAVVAGAAGYLSPETNAEELPEFVASIARGDFSFSPDIQRSLVSELRGAPNGTLPPLTPREREVLALLAEGHGAAQIAHHLSVALSTAKKHLQHVYEKLDAANSAAAVARAMRLGLIE